MVLRREAEVAKSTAELSAVEFSDKAFFTSKLVWLTGKERLANSSCEWARQGQAFGLQTTVCIPSANGVVELGSTESIFQSSDLMNKVRVLFDFNNLEVGSWPVAQTDQGENDPSSFWLSDPSSSVIEIRDSVNTTSVATAIAMTTVPTSVPEISNTIHFERPSLSSLTENPSMITIQHHHARNGSSSCKPESGEILNFGESERTSSSPSGTLFSNNSTQFAADDKKKKDLQHRGAVT
ncbi:hypothetical protein NE237_003561 [Protea cynaroides]|uniref:Transcription factor n=1 Tax=Protea cynaroides TaxID=273540 RepID=A0A9Q0KH77_9MAGN|nr:hypothetical protein NE237_003561 [Protea cynaroides]